MRDKRGKGRRERPLFPRGKIPPMPTFETPGDARARMRRERKMLTDAAFAERERRRLAEVRAAFFEGMAAGNDFLWMERPPDDYWLESDARRSLYAGPPRPDDPSRRAVLAMRNRGAPYDPSRDPGRVIGDSFSPPSPPPAGRKRRK